MSKRKPHLVIAGFSLVEVVLALGVFAVGALSLLGLFPVALGNTAEARQQTSATLIATSLFGQLRTKTNGVSFLEADRGRLAVPIDTRTSLRLIHDASLKLRGAVNEDIPAPGEFLTVLEVFPQCPTPGASTIVLKISSDLKKAGQRFCSILNTHWQ